MKTKLNQKYYDSGNSCKLEYLYTLDPFLYNEMTVYSLLNFSQKNFKINFPYQIDKNICMCPLPDNKVFCYGNNWIKNSNYSQFISGVTFIINQDLSIEILNEGYPSFGSGGIFYAGYVYVFGGFDAKKKINRLAAKFSLMENRWQLNPNLPFPACFCSYIEYMRFILVGGASRSQTILTFDIAGNSYSEILFGLKKTKILCKYNGYAYLINPEGNIYESGYNNPFIWKFIEKCGINQKFDQLASFQMVFESILFFIEYKFSFFNYYRFDLVRKAFKIID